MTGKMQTESKNEALVDIFTEEFKIQVLKVILGRLKDVKSNVRLGILMELFEK